MAGKQWLALVVGMVMIVSQVRIANKREEEIQKEASGS